ncbi:MAG: prolipoprotein diacylglyceryl transferase [Oscillospiraceae bacterium]|nr:prolipoprotein diacylglyceryl transferase [Oscillospiraceae bacterium]
MREALISFPMLGDWTINPPYSVQIGSFSIYLYGIVIAFGFLLAFIYCMKFCRRLDMEPNEIYDYLIWGLLAGIVGARLYYVVFNFSLYKDDLLGVFRIRDGGLAIYGGVIGAVIAIWLVARHKRASVWRPLDVAAFGLLIGQAAGRWGNFFNRECYGYETDIFCRMGLTLNGTTIYVHPTFLYESLWNVLGLIIMHIVCKKGRRYEGQFIILYVFWYGLGRMFIEGMRTDSLWLVQDVIRVSQLLAAVTMVLAGIVYVINFKRVDVGRRPLVGRPLDAGVIIDVDLRAPAPETENAAADESEVSDFGDAENEENAPPAENTADPPADGEDTQNSEINGGNEQ